MCLPGQKPAQPATATDAVQMAQAGLSWLAAADAGSLTAAEQAECLQALERAESMHTAAQARVLSAFATSGGYEDDGHGTARTWLKWQTRITSGAAAGAMAWARRLAAHPAVRDALAAGQLSESWARQVCAWTDLLPEAARGDADVILLAAAAGGADLLDLGALAEEIRRRCARPDEDGDDGFSDRGVRLGTTFRGAGRLDGDLTPGCAAALNAVLESLGKKAGPEDTRTKRQRHHDALEEACRRLIASGCLPERAGQPTQIQLHMSLSDLRGLPGAAHAEAAWPGPAAGPGQDCDATIVPVVTGMVDPVVLDQLAAALLRGAPAGAAPAGAAPPGSVGHRDSGTSPGSAAQPGASPGPGARPGTAESCGGEQSADPAQSGAGDVTRTARQQRATRAARQIVIAAAVGLLSGPGGLAAWLRTGVAPGPAASPSLPLDTGAATETIPAHLRRAVIARDRHCRFPGCEQPPAACQPHHIIPRSEGGPTSLGNLLLLCVFHHLIAVHRWGWQITLYPDATVAATSPDRSRVLHSHGPPSRAA
jgi:Domain of unknown function (DUF222)/HNH endonuclease